MQFEKMPSPSGFCIFCEDIRQEINGKQTLVGVVHAASFTVLGTLPAVVGKFCIHVSFRQRTTDTLGNLVFEIHMPGDDDKKPTAQASLSLTEAVEKMPPPPADSDDPFIGLAMAFEFNPLEIRQEGKIIVSAVKDDKRFRLGALKVVSRPPVSKAVETKEAAP